MLCLTGLYATVLMTAKGTQVFCKNVSVSRNVLGYLNSSEAVSKLETVTGC
jgi:hypothetical protein